MPINHTVLRKLDPDIVEEIRQDFIRIHGDKVLVHEVSPKAKTFTLSVRSRTGKWEKTYLKSSDSESPFLFLFFDLQKRYVENGETEKYRHISLIRFKPNLIRAILTSEELQSSNEEAA